MGKVMIALGGAGGIDPDECTAGRAQVLSGYTAGVHGEDDPVPGSMPERGTWNGSVGMNGSITVPAGHHSGSGKITGPTVTQRGAWNSRIGINGRATIPEGYHNGQGYVDQAIATQGGQTINPSASQQTVSTSGKYMTGNIIVNAISLPNASDLREGVNWYGRVGTLKDYSYLAAGQTSFNGASFSGVLGEGAEICYMDPYNNFHRDVPEITGNGLRMYTSTATNAYPHFCPKKSINMTPFKQIKVTGMYTGNSNGRGSFRVELWKTDVDKDLLVRNQAMGWLSYNLASLSSGGVEVTCTTDISGISGQAYLTVMFSNSAYKEWPNYFIKRIEFLT